LVPLIVFDWYPLILIASRIFTLVAGFGSQAMKKMAAFFARQSTRYSLLFEVILELFCCQEREKRSHSNNEPPRKGNNRGKATLSGPHPKTMENRSSGSANNAQSHCVGPDVTINLGN
jgi:hypothetical protein